MLLDGGNFNHAECALMSIISAKLYFDTLANFCINSDLMSPKPDKLEIIKSINALGQTDLDLKNKLIFEIDDNGNVRKCVYIQ